MAKFPGPGFYTGASSLKPYTNTGSCCGWQMGRGQLFVKTDSDFAKNMQLKIWHTNNPSEDKK